MPHISPCTAPLGFALPALLALLSACSESTGVPGPPAASLSPTPERDAGRTNAPTTEEAPTTALDNDAGSEGSACGAAPASPNCGDPCGEGVVIEEDVLENTSWDCPVYTLSQPVYVQAAEGSPRRTVLSIAKGTVIRGRSGDVEAGHLPGALIVTRSGRIDAQGTAEAPIVFTSAAPPEQRAPGDWGGVVLLGGAPTNVPEDFEGTGNLPGEMFIEGLPRTEATTYGVPRADTNAPDAGLASADAGPIASEPDAGADSAGNTREAEDYDCGTLRYVRIEYAGFEVGDSNELNGLTVGGCGRDTTLDYIQVHLGSDDGIEFFGGTAGLRHAVITGAKDDSLDWDQGWRGTVQYLAIQQHDDSLRVDDQGDNGFEGDGYADPERPIDPPSSPVVYNLTLFGSVSSTRALRLREGTGLTLRNALILVPEGGASAGLVDVSDALTADQLRTGAISIESTIFRGNWSSEAKVDSEGTPFFEEAIFGAAPANTLLFEDPSALVAAPFQQTGPSWVPERGSSASFAWTEVRAEDIDMGIDGTAQYRGAFPPGGEDWTSGWTVYPPAARP